VFNVLKKYFYSGSKSTSSMSRDMTPAEFY